MSRTRRTMYQRPLTPQRIVQNYLWTTDPAALWREVVERMGGNVERASWMWSKAAELWGREEWEGEDEPEEPESEKEANDGKAHTHSTDDDTDEGAVVPVVQVPLDPL